MSISSNLSEIERYLVIAKQEDVKLARGVKSSAAKLRSALLEIGKECSECRKVVLDLGKNIEVKKRVPKEEKKAEELPLLAPALERQDGSEDVEPAESSPISLAPVKKPRVPRKKAAPAAVVADA